MTTPTVIGSLVTSAEVASELGVAVATPDTMRRVDAAAAAIRRAAGWHIGPVVTETLTLDSDGGRVLPLPTGRLVSLVAVAADGVDITPYVRKSAGGWLKRDYGHFPDNPESVVVTITHGYAAGTYPDLVALVVAIAGRATEVTGVAVAQESIGARSVTYREPGIFAHELEQLTPFYVGRTA